MTTSDTQESPAPATEPAAPAPQQPNTIAGIGVISGFLGAQVVHAVPVTALVGAGTELFGDRDPCAKKGNAAGALVDGAFATMGIPGALINTFAALATTGQTSFGTALATNITKTCVDERNEARAETARELARGAVPATTEITGGCTPDRIEAGCSARILDADKGLAQL